MWVKSLSAIAHLLVHRIKMAVSDKMDKDKKKAEEEAKKKAEAAKKKAKGARISKSDLIKLQ